MAIIREDAKGVYVRNGGYISRPSKHRSTKYQKGEKVDARHFTCSMHHRVGDEVWVHEPYVGNFKMDCVWMLEKYERTIK